MADKIKKNKEEPVEEQQLYNLHSFLDIALIKPSQRLYYTKVFGKNHKEQTLSQWKKETNVDF